MAFVPRSAARDESLVERGIGSHRDRLALSHKLVQFSFCLRGISGNRKGNAEICAHLSPIYRVAFTFTHFDFQSLSPFVE